MSNNLLTNTRLRLFSLGGGLFLLALIVSLSKQSWWLWPIPIALFLWLGALVIPKSLEWILHSLDKIHYLVGSLLFSLVFYLFITPFGFLMNVFGSKLIDLRIDIKRETYWYKPDQKIDSSEYFKNQF